MSKVNSFWMGNRLIISATKLISGDWPVIPGSISASGGAFYASSRCRNKW